MSLIDSRLRRAWPDDPNGPAWFTSSGYQLYARTPGDFVAVRAPALAMVDDVLVHGTFRKIGGPPGGGYGLIVRDRRSGAGNGIDQMGQFVVAGIGDKGEMRIWRRDGDRWLDLIPWTPSTSVRRENATNELTVEVIGTQLKFDVNGQRVASITAPIMSGQVGIFVGGDLNQVLVEHMTVQPLPSAPPGSGLQGAERDLATANSRIAELSARARRAAESTHADEVRWRDEVAGVASVVHHVASDLSAERSAASREPARVQRLTALLWELEHEIAGVVEGFQDGIDSPRSPVNSPAALATAASRLESASRKAEQLRDEVEALRRDAGGPGT